MKLIIAGSWHFTFISAAMVERIVSGFDLRPNEIVSGMASGADAAGVFYADDYKILLKEFPADWGKHGKAAGPIRNREMAEYADALLLLWDGKSSGSFNMRWEMIKRKKPVFEVIFQKVPA